MRYCRRKLLKGYTMTDTWQPSCVHPYEKACARWRSLFEAFFTNPLDLNLEQEEKAARKIVDDWKF